jgi:hypothetical protein
MRSDYQRHLEFRLGAAFPKSRRSARTVTDRNSGEAGTALATPAPAAERPGKVTSPGTRITQITLLGAGGEHERFTLDRRA